jgi:hypothetical protein
MGHFMKNLLERNRKTDQQARWIPACSLRQGAGQAWK